MSFDLSPVRKRKTRTQKTFPVVVKSANATKKAPVKGKAFPILDGVWREAFDANSWNVKGTKEFR